MTEKQLMKVLHAREVSARTESTSTYGDVIILDDAYCILVLLDKRERLKGKAKLAWLGYSMEHMLRLFYRDIAGKELRPPHERHAGACAQRCISPCERSRDCSVLALRLR